MEVAPRIHRIEAPFGDRFVCMFLLVGESATLLVDSGTDPMPGQFLAPYLDDIGLSPAAVRYVITSHADFDHNAGNASVAELCPNAVFMCHALDRVMTEDIERMIADRYREFEADHGIGDGEEGAEFVRSGSRTVPMDLLLQGGESLRLGPDWCVDVLHTAGHTRGHLSLYDGSSDTLVIADAALYNAVLRADGEPAFPPTYRYAETYRASAQRLAAIGADTLLTSHYPVQRGAQVAEFLAESAAFHDRLEAALRAELRGADGPRTLKELCHTLGPRLGRWPETAHDFCAFPLMGHLERLQSHGLVATARRDGVVTFTWS